MSSSNVKATVRMVAASFAAGASAMLLFGLVGPIAVKGGLSVRDAMASSVDERAPTIEPLDVAAIEAQLAQAEALMADMRANTDDEVSRLAELAGR